MRSSNFRSPVIDHRPPPPGERRSARGRCRRHTRQHADGPAGGGERHHLDRGAADPNFALRRSVAATLAIAVLLAIGCAVMSLTGLGSPPAVASETGSAASASGNATYVAPVHVVAAGDTLWSIAEQHRGSMSVVDYVDRLIDLNGGTTVHVGQFVTLPAAP
ncbi:MAG: LysM domain-containing protein [Actinomycetota bacterium]